MTRSLRGEPAVLADGAVEVAQVCASEFLSLVVSEARVRVAREGRASVTDADILGALGALGFKGFVEPLRAFVATHYAPRGGGGGPMSGAKRALEQAQAVQRPVKPKQEKLVVCPFPGCGKSFVESTGMRRHTPGPPERGAAQRCRRHFSRCPRRGGRGCRHGRRAPPGRQEPGRQGPGRGERGVAGGGERGGGGRLRRRLDCPKCKLEVHLLPAPQRTIVKCDACGQMMGGGAGAAAGRRRAKAAGAGAAAGEPAGRRGCRAAAPRRAAWVRRVRERARPPRRRQPRRGRRPTRWRPRRVPHRPPCRRRRRSRRSRRPLHE